MRITIICVVALFTMRYSPVAGAQEPPAIQDLYSHIQSAGHASDPDQLEDVTFLVRCAYSLRAVAYCNWVTATHFEDDTVASYYEFAQKAAPILRGCVKTHLDTLRQVASDSPERKILIQVLSQSIDELQVLVPRSAPAGGGPVTSVEGGHSQAFKLTGGNVELSADSIVITPAAKNSLSLTVPRALINGLKKTVTGGVAPFQFQPDQDLNLILTTAQNFATTDRSKQDDYLDVIDAEHAAGILKLAELATEEKPESQSQVDRDRVVQGVSVARNALNAKVARRISEGQSLKPDLSKIGASDRQHFQEYRDAVRNQRILAPASAPSRQLKRLDDEKMRQFLRP